jgi:DnaJ-class molecular chaperone
MSDQPAPTQPCTGPGDRTETTTVDGVTRQTWHSCPTCHGSH